MSELVLHWRQKDVQSCYCYHWRMTDSQLWRIGPFDCVLCPPVPITNPYCGLLPIRELLPIFNCLKFCEI